MSDHSIKRFTAYRRNMDECETSDHDETTKNTSDEVQYEGVVFTDGTCVLRWRTAINSCSVWDSFTDAMLVHGHPEYGTEIVFHDGELELPWEQEQNDES